CSSPPGFKGIAALFIFFSVQLSKTHWHPYEGANNPSFRAVLYHIGGKISTDLSAVWFLK
ncbi:MAG: hypothetical protein ACYSO7_08840, partial [Planctomycetota bacterium]